MNKNFKIYSICLVKNEGDIIEHCLRKALEWSDEIIVYENNSSDDTWEKVIALSKEDKRIIPWRRTDKPYSNSLRAEVFQAFKENAKEGDWWCRLDADEFYIQNPKSFLAGVPSYAHVVCGISIYHFLTSLDTETIDFTKPVEVILPQIKYYKALYSEWRFFRHRKGLKWDIADSGPKHMGVVNRERILYKHYQYRSPQQIQLRIDTRRVIRERGYMGWAYEKAINWRGRIFDTKGLDYYLDDGKYIINQDFLPKHIEPFYIRIIKLFMHGVGIWP